METKLTNGQAAAALENTMFAGLAPLVLALGAEAPFNSAALPGPYQNGVEMVLSDWSGVSNAGCSVVAVCER